jgi:hypothetical protein
MASFVGGTHNCLTSVSDQSVARFESCRYYWCIVMRNLEQLRWLVTMNVISLRLIEGQMNVAVLLGMVKSLLVE